MQLHMILFSPFVALLDLLRIFQNLFVQMPDTIFIINQNFHQTFSMGKPQSAEYPLQLFLERVKEPNHTCLLLTLLLSPPIIIWLAEM